MSGMRFLYGYYFWYLIPVFLLPILWWGLQLQSQKKLSGIFTEGSWLKLTPGFRPKRRYLKFLFLWLALISFIFALARPQMGQREEILPQQGSDLVVLLDVSRSMATEDVVPSRIKKAKHLIKTLLEQASGDRVGLVIFAGHSFAAVPLTTDFDYISQNLETINEDSVPTQGTNLAGALRTALDLLERGGVNSQAGEEAKADEDTSGQGMLLISDGEDQVGKESEVIGPLKTAHIPVYAIGVGSFKGAPIPLRDANGNLQGYKKDKSGNTVLSKLETKSLENISNSTGGKFFVASSDEREVPQIVNIFHDATEKDEDGTKPGRGRRVIIYGEYFQVPLALGVLGLILSVGLPEVVAIVLACLLTSQAQAGYRDFRETRKGMEAYTSSELPTAVEHFTRAQALDPDSPLHHFNLGTSLLKSGAAETAVTELKNAQKKSLDQKAPVLDASSTFNLAKSLEKQGQHDEALSELQNGLQRIIENLRDPAVSGTDKKSLEELLMKFRASLQQTRQNQKQKQKEDKEKQEKKDQEQKEDQQQKQDQKQDQKDGKDQNKDGKGKDKDKSSPPVTKKQREFKSETLSPQDAQRLMQQLKEQDNQTLNRFRRDKAKQKQNEASRRNPDRRENREEENEKDW